ncbi:unnamed protein product [Protopolystoma xenopodis]|uniref:Uncharacterized protein n=1 Tax=Protopolystoma xenopodis TaxID=117903 RepID=A0A448WYE8_9PLAT|nr:unnamed protein product [Protopolystoma xenopodis]
MLVQSQCLCAEYTGQPPAAFREDVRCVHAPISFASLSLSTTGTRQHNLLTITYSFVCVCVSWCVYIGVNDEWLQEYIHMQLVVSACVQTTTDSRQQLAIGQSNALLLSASHSHPPHPRHTLNAGPPPVLGTKTPPTEDKWCIRPSHSAFICIHPLLTSTISLPLSADSARPPTRNVASQSDRSIQLSVPCHPNGSGMYQKAESDL